MIKDGKCTEFYESGNVKVEYFYKDNIEYGPITTYFENGNVKLKGQYIWGSPVGNFYYSNENNKLDSIIEYILWQDNETVFEYLERDTITREIAQTARLYENSVVIFDGNGKINMDKSLYYEVSFDSIIRNDTMKFYLFFSNPYSYYEYKSDSVEISTYVDSIKNKDISYILLSRKSSIHLTGKHILKKGEHFFYSIISLHQNDGIIRKLLIKVPFETGDFSNIGNQVFTSIDNPLSARIYSLN